MYWPVLSSSIFCKAHMHLGFGQARSGPVLTNRHKTCSQCTCARLLVHIEIGRGRWFLAFCCASRKLVSLTHHGQMGTTSVENWALAEPHLVGRTQVR